ncbi:MAG: DHA2 family efflux MFS transporter permease subunit [Acidimicrobiia bacterium]|nr:DHA2 family efflux MFS transporter permease subunit [Acidimicrobiia bacterium]
MSQSQMVQEKAYERRWAVLGVLCFSLLVIVLDNTILNVAIPTISNDLNPTTAQLQWMVDSYTLVFAGLLLTAGSLGDRFGRRGALQIGLVLFGIGSVLSALSNTPNELIAARAFMGIGGAFIMPATLSIITNIFPDEERARAIGIWAATAGVGVALGPIVGGALVADFYWGSIFLVNIPIVAVGLIAGLFLIPTSKDPSASKLDVPGALLSITSLTAILFAIIEGPPRGWTDPVVVASFVGGVMLLGAFIWWELKTETPMLNMQFFRNRRFTASTFAVAMSFFVLFGSTFLLTQYMQFVLGYSPLQAGTRLLPFAAVILVVAPLSPRIVQSIGTRVTVSAGLAIAGLAMLLMTGLDATSSYADIVWMLMLMALGQALVMAPATDAIMGSVPREKAGVGSAVNDTTRQVGGALGVAVIGSVMSLIYSPKIVDFFAGPGALVPDSAKIVAEDSIGGALQIAGSVPGAIGDQLAEVAKGAFVSGLHAGLLVAGAVGLVGAVVTYIVLPASHDESS